jgi:hypothetical protein
MANLQLGKIASDRGDLVNSPTGGLFRTIGTRTGIAVAVRCEARLRNVMMCCTFRAERCGHTTLMALLV